MGSQAATRSINTVDQSRRKRTQRERLIDGVIAVSNRDGCARATVSAVIAEAGVSRPTFYEYFGDRDDCFLAALGDVQTQLLDAVRESVSASAPERAIRAAIDTLVSFAAAKPALARFLTSESMAAGPTALDIRDHGIAEIQTMIEEAHRDMPAGTPVPDVSLGVLIGCVYRLLARRLRRGERRLAALTDDLLRWIGSYACDGEHRWRSLTATSAPAVSPFLPGSPMHAPSALGPGRPRLSEEQVAANHRQRIMFAAAQLAEQRGYAATTITEITNLAGVDGRAFYALFADKQDAFMTAHELGFQEIMAVSAGAFFAGESWPERSWEAGRAFTQFLEQNPTVAQVGFVHAYAVSAGAIQRVEDSHVAFTIFLQQGYQHAPGASPPSRLALEAIITAIFEIVYRQARISAKPRLAGLLPHITFLWLTPFIGAREANAFIDRQLAGG
jgi:AcrR family transcriptional regulator